MFELGIFLVNYINASLPLDNFAFGDYVFLLMLLLSLSYNFLFIPECYSSFCQIVWRHFNLYLITGQYLYIMHSHFSGYMRCDNMSVFELNPEHCI